MNPKTLSTPTKDDFAHWEKTKDIIDQLIDIILNYRQSGHPGGSRSKVHILLSLMLSGAMRWDIRDPGKRFTDRFILAAGHTIPVIYCTLAVLNEAIREKFKQTADERFSFALDTDRVLNWEDLIHFRRKGGLSGHAEMEGKTLFLKFNTGPSGHGSSAAVGEALALKRAGLGQVRVFALEGEGGLTPGVNHEAMNSAWGLKLDNLYFLIDWNDYGIDDHPISKVVYGKPKDWFAPHGWDVFGTEEGEKWEAVASSLLEATNRQYKNGAPGMVWSKTRKGRGYLKYDNFSHGSPHPTNSEKFWEIKNKFAEKYGAEFVNIDGPAPQEESAFRAEFKANLKAAIDVLLSDQKLVDYLAERLVSVAEMVPADIPMFRFGKKGNPLKDTRIYDFKNYPLEMYAQPGEKLANRAALARWGAWVNAFGAENYDQPVFMACSADLCASTNVKGFGDGFGAFPGYGWYERKGDDEGVLLPQAITEMANSGIMAALASVNFSENPESDFLGLYGACSTYGSFSYLKYGMLRLFSQMAQDCDWKLGKVLWVAGHSGPETADDSRTHFGVFSPGVTQLFPDGHIINLHPWEFNEVPVLLGEALKQDAPLIALHLTRPAIPIPDRVQLGMASHFEAAKGAYLIRDYRDGEPKGGTIIVQGTSAMANLVKILPDLDAKKINVKLIYAASRELFNLQPKSYREKLITPADRMDSTYITTQSRALMRPWNFNYLADKYALSSDWDNCWRTGGNLEEVVEEAHLSPGHLLIGIERFTAERSARLERLRAALSLTNVV